MTEIPFMNKNFDTQKSDSLQKNDLSRKGSVDFPIAEMVKKINDSNDFFTTSSCSGRAVVFSLDPQNRKKNCVWHLTSHEPISFPQLQEAIEKSEFHELTIKFEPLILHIQCRTLEFAKKLHQIALDSGFRNSGLTIGKSGKFTLAIRSTLALEIPFNKFQMTSMENLRLLFEHWSIKLQEKFKMNDELRERLQKALEGIIT